MNWPWKKKKNEHEDIMRELNTQERIIRDRERRVRRLEQEERLQRLRGKRA